MECQSHLIAVVLAWSRTGRATAFAALPLCLSLHSDRDAAAEAALRDLESSATRVIERDISTPGLEVKSFTVRGNTVLSETAIQSVLREGTGTNTSLIQIRAALLRLRQAYRDQGFHQARVTLPRQVFMDGTVLIDVAEGSSTEAAAAEWAAKLAPQPPLPVPTNTVRTFQVDRYEVAGNTLLNEDAVDGILRQATGPAVALPDIQKALGDLQIAYRDRGFATVAVALPQQQLTNAVVKVKVTEGLLTDITVTGNRYVSSNNVRRALPSLTTNVILNNRVFQRELDLANQNRDRQIFPVLGPGPEPGSSALNLRVKDRSPLHGRLDVNNHATPGTPEWRVNASAQYNNLWQREHQVGLSYGFAPEAFKSEGLMSDHFFDRPLIAYAGAYYRMPLGSAESLADRINGSTGFGYDEATRQFRLPPAGSRPDLTFFASSSSSDTGVKLSPKTVVSQTPLLTIVSQDSGQNLSINHSAGSRLSVPLTIDDNRRLSFGGGLDAKLYSLDSFNTNNFIITTVVTNAQGSQTIESRVASPQPARHNEVAYLPLVVSADYSQTDKSGTLAANLTLSGNFLGQDDDFQALGTSSETRSRYGRAALSLTRDQKVFENWSLLLRGNGQVATGPLISNEQFALGGLNSVRGYYEGDEYGDVGWFGSAELRTPYWATQVPLGAQATPVWLRGSVFVDGGQRFLLNAPEGADATNTLLGAGVGASANLNNHLDLRVTIGWPLRDSASTSAYDPRAYLSIGGQF